MRGPAGALAYQTAEAILLRGWETSDAESQNDEEAEGGANPRGPPDPPAPHFQPRGHPDPRPLGRRRDMYETS